MARNIWEKIEWIRRQPEHIRMRYVFGCLLVSMIFISGVWLLSVKESFRNIGRDVPAAAEKGKALLPDGGVPSLGDLMKKDAPLRVNGQDEKTGQQYFEEQFRSQSEQSSGNDTESQPVPAP